MIGEKAIHIQSMNKSKIWNYFELQYVLHKDITYIMFFIEDIMQSDLQYVLDIRCYILGINILLQTFLVIPGKEEEEKTHNVQRDPQ